MNYRLDKPDIFKVQQVIEDRNLVPNHIPDQLVRYFYPGSELLELGVQSKGFNEFTTECDKYRRPDYIPKDPEYEKITRTYLYNGGVVFTDFNHDLACKKYGYDHIGYVVVRSPGATRGSLIINLDTRTIIDILFNSSTCFNCNYGCYTKDILSLVDKYKGKEYVVDYINDVSYPGEAL